MVLFAGYLFCGLINAQEEFISIDGQFDDWIFSEGLYADPEGDAVQNDLLELHLANDQDYFFIRFKLAEEVDLTSALFPHDLSIHIDGDGNANTGLLIESFLGAELSIYFASRFIYTYVNGSTSFHSFAELNIHLAPTVSSNEFELAIPRALLLDNGANLFSSSNVSVALLDEIFPDIIPDQNTGQIIYSFTEDVVEFPVVTNFDKAEEEVIRVFAYNILFNGLNDEPRRAAIRKLLVACQPDIVCFSEAANVDENDAQQMLDFWLPTENPLGWYVEKDDYDLITASRWPIAQIYPQVERSFPTLIDLPQEYGNDLLITNSHLKCCDDNETRQEQIDEYLAFILDAKSTGGTIDLPENTPFILVGDLNLVTDAQHLQSLLDGHIVNTATYGQGAPLDWDNTLLEDQAPNQIDNPRFNYTWEDEGSSFPTGRLDFQIYSDAVMTAEKAFIVNTNKMNAQLLQNYNLDATTCATASDHFPVIVDYSIPTFQNTGISESMLNDQLAFITENKELVLPVMDHRVHWQLYHLNGRLLREELHWSSNEVISLKEYPTGVLLLRIKTPKAVHTQKLCLP